MILRCDYDFEMWYIKYQEFGIVYVHIGKYYCFNTQNKPLFILPIRSISITILAPSEYICSL